MEIALQIGFNLIIAIFSSYESTLFAIDGSVPYFPICRDIGMATK